MKEPEPAPAAEAAPGFRVEALGLWGLGGLVLRGLGFWGLGVRGSGLGSPGFWA